VLCVQAFFAGSLWLRLIVLSFTAFFQFAAGIAFWAIASTCLDRRAAAIGVAIISSIGATGGFVSASLLGWVKDLTGRLDDRIFVVASFSLIGSFLVLAILPVSALRVGTS